MTGERENNVLRRLNIVSDGAIKLQISCSVYAKNYENWLTVGLDKVAKMSRLAFLAHPV